MLVADLKCKLTLSELVSEDFLTSSVFSTFRYLDKQWIEKFIHYAINIKKQRLNIKLEEPIYEFWPWYSNEPKFGRGAEPDVVIYSGETVIIIEAKNYSEKSSVGTVPGGLKQSDEIQEKGIIDQLGREYFVGLKKILNSKYNRNEEIFSIKDFYLIFLTRHNFFPNYEIEETIKSITHILPREYQSASKRIYWLNWQKIVPLLEEIVAIKTKNSFEYKISLELIEFLERRDLGTFSGFEFLDAYGKFSIEFISDCLFYRTIFRKYWDYLDEFKLSIKNQKNNIFYLKNKLPYWGYLPIDFDIQFDKRIFYME